jgi:hypothetical protein
VDLESACRQCSSGLPKKVVWAAKVLSAMVLEGAQSEKIPSGRLSCIPWDHRPRTYGTFIIGS